MPRICHGIFDAEVGAYTRQSVFDQMALYSAWKRKEEKRIAKVQKAKDAGKDIDEEDLKFRERELVEIDVPLKFDMLLERKARMTAALEYYMPVAFYNRLPKEVKQSLNGMYRQLEFTMYEDEGITSIAITHIGDSFSRKEGYTIAKGRWEKAKRGGYPKGSPFIWFEADEE
jgi:hypothetical protein